jgi:glucokinase
MVAGRVATSVIGIDVGGTKILAGIVERDGTVLESRERPTPTDSQEILLEALEGVVRTLLADHPEVAAVGFGIPSRIDQRSGSAVASTNVPLADVPFRARMGERFQLPVGLDNDANAAAIAEWAVGAGRGTSNLVMLTLGTGVGGGVVIGGKPFRGSTGAGVELGHIVIDVDGPPCQGTCTGRGHLEALVCGGAADRLAVEVVGPHARARDLVRSARAGDRRAAEAVRQAGRSLGSGIATLVNIFEPEVVILGGGFTSGAADLLLPAVREMLAREALEPARDHVRIELAQLGVEAGLVGAGLVAFEALDGRL